MGLGFLAPLFAIGALGIVVPLLVHLVHKERKDAVAFPSLMFVQRTPYQHSARQRIRDWLLFAARCLVILLLAAAFARPLVESQRADAAMTAGAREVVVLLDRSLSMRYGDRWTRAQDATRRAIAGVSGRDRLTLIPFDARAAIVNDASADQALLRAALDSIEPSDGATRLAPAVSLARRVLGASNLPRKELLVISDFQRSAWDLSDDVSMPEGTSITPVDVSSGVVQDRSVRAVETRREVVDGSAPSEGDRVIVTARLVNVGPAAKGVGIALEVGGRVVERRTVDLPADAGGVASFAPVAVPSGGVNARVVLDPDGLTADDSFHFILERAPTVAVLLVEHSNAPPERGVFVARALAIGDHPAFDIKAVRSERVTAADLQGRRLVILNDAGVPPGIGGARLTAFVRGGGGLLTALGERSLPSDWPEAGRSLLPGTFGAAIDRLGSRGAVLGYLDRSHPALSVFGAARSGDLSGARFFRYRALQANDGVMARFDDGAPALVEHREGRGRVLTWASAFDGYWNDLPRQAVFLPFLHQMARHAAAYRERPSAWQVGDAIDVSEAGMASALPDSAPSGAARVAERFSVVAPNGERLAVGGSGNPSALEARQSGFYEVRRSGAPNERARTVAANVAPREVEFATFDPLRLTGALAPVSAASGSATTVDPVEARLEREREQSIWWYLLVVVAMLLLAEAILARRATRRLQPS